jgi:AraC-like DNA-binding protein
MDALSQALRGMRITGALLFNAELTAPWGFASPPGSAARRLLAPDTEHLVLFHLVTEGKAIARVASEEVELGPGDVVVLPHGNAHELASGPVLELVDAATLLPKILAGSLELERGGGGGALTRFVCGYFGCERYAERLFLAGLPPLFKVSLRGDPSGEWIEGSLRHLLAEHASRRPGRAALISKLTEALFIETLARYLDRLPPDRTGWLAGARDEVVGRALAAFHRDPAAAWTLAEVAKEAGASRTVLAERFQRFLGQPPLAYLARWRLALAARLLDTTDRTALQVALEVGYESEAAFNRAFKREFELPPGRYRRRRETSGLSGTGGPPAAGRTSPAAGSAASVPRRRTPRAARSPAG